MKRLAALTLAALGIAGLALAALAVQGPDRWLGEFSGDGSRLTNVMGRAVTGAAWGSPWCVQTGGALVPQDSMVPSGIWIVTTSGALRVAVGATNGVDGCWEYLNGALRPKTLED